VKAQIITAGFTNTDSGDQTFSVWIVRSGGAPDDASLVVDAAPLETTQSDVSRILAGRNLGPGDAIYASASVGSKVVCVIDGYEMA
jgi:hypothetical protein